MREMKKKNRRLVVDLDGFSEVEDAGLNKALDVLLDEVGLVFMFED